MLPRTCSTARTSRSRGCTARYPPSRAVRRWPRSSGRAAYDGQESPSRALHPPRRAPADRTAPACTRTRQAAPASLLSSRDPPTTRGARARACASVAPACSPSAPSFQVPPRVSNSEPTRAHPRPPRHTADTRSPGAVSRDNRGSESRCRARHRRRVWSCLPERSRHARQH